MADGFGPAEGEPTLRELDQEETETAWAEVAKLRAKVERLRGELLKVLNAAMREGAPYITTGDRQGWWDSEARRSICDIGDRLVELGIWERHPDGYGGRWFYRPIEKAAPTKAMHVS